MHTHYSQDMDVTSESLVTQESQTFCDPLDNPPARAIATGVYVTVHGHFYQPPRENPYLGAVERQPSASPFHDWNERVHYECYRPNAFARVLNEQGELINIVNNFEYLSFNVGPTLMSWLDTHDPEVYQRIIDADQASCQRLNGHGNAIAQVYNHIIMPLANERDKQTQVHWGKEDFRSRFGRDPEGMWLAETAVDYATIETLIAENIKFIILAPSQAQRCRPLPKPDQSVAQWTEVGGGQIDPIRPYRCFLPGGDLNTDYIDIFFYDGPISRDMGFNDVLASSRHFADRIGQAVRGDRHLSQLISVATDGETFGHHKGGAEKALAYAVSVEFPNRGWQVTNYAHYLSLCPPQWEVELKPVTAWSCSHGVDRWKDNCGCGGGGVWHQNWRRPLRETLDWLRDRLSSIYDTIAGELLHDPWHARDEYIHVIHDRRSETVRAFLDRHQSHLLSQEERINVLQLLEMQHHTLLMYTSCGWFFEELSRPEGVQILRYASRAIDLAETVSGIKLESEFIQRLSHAPSNVDVFRNGAEIYRQLVKSSHISIEQVAAHYAISSLFESYAPEQKVYCYWASQLDYHIQRIGPLTLAIGQLELTSEITHESRHLIFGVLHLGGWDIHCCVTSFAGRLAYAKVQERLFNVLSQGNIARIILTMNEVLGDRTYTLQDLFADERQRIMELLSDDTLAGLDQLYTQVYRENYSVLMAFHRDHLVPPRELQVAAEIAIGHKITDVLGVLQRCLLESPLNEADCLGQIAELQAIATEAQHLNCSLSVPQAKLLLEEQIVCLLQHLMHEHEHETFNTTFDCLRQLIDVGDRLNLCVNLSHAQELYMNYFHDTMMPTIRECQHKIHALPEPEHCTEILQLRNLLHVGKALFIDVQHVLEQLS
jgi:alpha-amylase/alpha-mannosidase (GH57 family)